MRNSKFKCYFFPFNAGKKYIYLPVISALPLGSTYWLSEIHSKTHSLEYFLMDSVEHGEYNPHSHIQQINKVNQSEMVTRMAWNMEFGSVIWQSDTCGLD